MIDKWKLALKEFLKKYEKDEMVVGAVLYDSYALGIQNEYSNIKVYLVLKDSANYKEKGFFDSNSYLIEYIIKPLSKIKDTIKNEFDNGYLTTAKIFAYGKVIYDLDDSVKELSNKALDYIDSNLKVISSDKVNYNNYHIWNYLNELKSNLKENSMQFNLTYYKLLDMVFNSYLEYLGVPKLKEDEIYKVLTDYEYRRKCHIYKLPEEEFIKLYLNCLEIDKASTMLKNIESLVNYYYKKEGGFNIRVFVAREDFDI